MKHSGDNERLGGLETTLVLHINALVHPGINLEGGHENGGAIGVSDGLNRARIAFAALRHRWGPLDTDDRWGHLRFSPRDLKIFAQSVADQTTTPGIDGTLGPGLLSLNPTVPDEKVRALFARRWDQADALPNRALDASDNSVMVLRACSGLDQLRDRFWDLLLQLRARRRSAQWTDAPPDVRAGGRRDETTGKVTGSAIVTVLEWRLLLDPRAKLLDFADDEIFWLARMALENMPFVDVSIVFQARNLTSKLRDLVGRADVSVNYIGAAPREQVPLYAAIHQHYSADSAALVGTYIQRRVLGGDTTDAAMMAFLNAVDHGGEALAPYLESTTLTGFRRCAPAVQQEALEVLARLWRTVRHVVPGTETLAALLLYAPEAKGVWERVFASKEDPSEALVADVVFALSPLKTGILSAPDGHVALQRLRLFSILSRWCRLHLPSGKRGHALARRLWQVTGDGAFAAFLADKSVEEVLGAAREAVCRRHHKAARRLMMAGIDADLDPLWVDGVLKETALAGVAQTETPTEASWWTEGGEFFLEDLFAASDADRPRHQEGLVLAEWNDEAVMRSRPRVVFCAVEKLPPPLCHARFWAEEQGTDIVPVADLSELRTHLGAGCVRVEVAKRKADVTPVIEPLEVTPRRRVRVHLVDDKDRSQHRERDWAEWTSEALDVHLPALDSIDWTGPLCTQVDAEGAFRCLARFGAKGVLLEAARNAVEASGASVPTSAAVSFGACDQRDWPAVMKRLETCLPPRTPWIFRSAGRAEDLPGHTKTGELSSVGSARSKKARIAAADLVTADASEKTAGGGISLLVQPHLRPSQSGVAFSRASDGAMGQVSYQVVKGEGGGVKSAASAQHGVLVAFGDVDPQRHLPKAQRETLRNVVLAIERELNATFFPSGAALWPVEVEWLVAKGVLYVVQARFHPQGTRSQGNL